MRGPERPSEEASHEHQEAPCERTLIALVVGGGPDRRLRGRRTRSRPPPRPPPRRPRGRRGSAGGGATLTFSAPADGSLKFDQGDATAKAGKVTVDFANPSSVPHAVEIEGNGVEEKTDVITASDAPPIKVDLKPGTYTYYCPVGDHGEAGMKGTLTVE